MKRFLVSIIFLLIGAFLLAWVIDFVGWEQVKAAFRQFSGPDGLAILALTFLGIIFATLRWREIIKSQGYIFPVKKLLRPILIARAIDYLAPTIPFGGTIFQGYILKEKFGLPWKTSISTALADQILEITSRLIFIFFGLIFFLVTIGFPPLNLALILGICLFASSIPVFFFYFKSHRRESLIKIFFKRRSRLLEAEDEFFNFLNIKNFVFWKSLMFSVLHEGVFFLRSFLLILFLGGKFLSFFSALSIFAFSTLIQLVPIPAALGSHEIVQTFVFNSLGLGKNMATAFTMIIRGADLIFAFLGIFLILGLGVKLSLNFNQKEENTKK